MFVEWGEAADRRASPKGRERPRLCENAPSRDLLRIFSLGRALTMMSEDFLAAVSPKSRPKFYFEKECPSFHTAWTQSCHQAATCRRRAKRTLRQVLTNDCALKSSIDSIAHEMEGRT